GRREIQCLAIRVELRLAAHSHQRILVDGEGQHKTHVVVGVLADQVNPSRGAPDAFWRVPVDLGGLPVQSGHALRGFLGVADAHGMTSRSRAAVCSAGTSLMNAPMAASEPARNLSLSAARRGLVSCRCRREASRSLPATGAWCQAEM